MKPSLLEKVKQDLRALRLKDMADILEVALEAAHQEQQGHIQFLDRLVQEQRRAMAERSLDRRIKQAKCPKKMTFEHFDWGFQPGLNVEYLKDLIQLDFVPNRQTVLILGKTGTGKPISLLLLASKHAKQVIVSCFSNSRTYFLSSMPPWQTIPQMKSLPVLHVVTS